MCNDVIQINNEGERCWLNFMKWLENKDSTWIYRGVSDNEYLLLPSIGRLDYSLSKEMNLFSHFKRRGFQHIQGKDDVEWLAVAQHHGLPTRLLDWTMNPLVAIFFACRNLIKDGRIYAARNSNTIDVSKFESPFDIQFLSFIFPPINSNRMDLQKGIFSIHPCPNIPVYISEEGSLEYLDDMNPSDNGIKTLEIYQNIQRRYYKRHAHDNYFDIPECYKDYFMRKINSLGIDELIFGDLDSVSNYLKQRIGVLPFIIEIDERKRIPQVARAIKNEFITYLHRNFSSVMSEFDGVVILPQKVNVLIDKFKYRDSPYNVEGYVYLHIDPIFDLSEYNPCFISNMKKLLGPTCNIDDFMLVKVCFNAEVFAREDWKFTLHRLKISIDAQDIVMSGVPDYNCIYQQLSEKLKKSKYWNNLFKYKLLDYEITSIKNEILNMN